MSYEINILVVNQTQPVHLPFEPSFVLVNEIEHEGCGRYFSSWPFYSCMHGVQYSLIEDEESIFLGAFPLCEVDFDYTFANPCPEWIPEEYAEQNFHPLIIKPSVYPDFIRVLKFLLESSPNGFLLFQTRYQGAERDTVFGTISLDDFIAMLDRREVMFNTCYIIAQKTEIEEPVYYVDAQGRIWRR